MNLLQEHTSSEGSFTELINILVKPSAFIWGSGKRKNVTMLLQCISVDNWFKAVCTYIFCEVMSGSYVNSAAATIGRWLFNSKYSIVLKITKCYSSQNGRLGCLSFLPLSLISKKIRFMPGISFVDHYA
jgi:hypothetical protein